MNFQELLPLTKLMSMTKVQVKSQRSMSQRSKQILPQFGCFRTVTPVWIHQWLWNNAQSLKLHRRGALLFFKVIYSNIKVTHDKKIADFDQIIQLCLVYPDVRLTHWCLSVSKYRSANFLLCYIPVGALMLRVWFASTLKSPHGDIIGNMDYMYIK